MNRPHVHCYYWREDRILGNLGDALVPVLLRELGYDVVSHKTVDSSVLNAGRCLIVIGSILTQSRLSQIHTPVDVWGCGWKGAILSQEQMKQIRIYAVRGPLTVANLGLPPATPLGDPALLLPYLASRPIRSSGHTLVIPHFSRVRFMPASVRRQQTGCDQFISPYVFQGRQIGTPGWLRQLLSLGKYCMLSGLSVYSPWVAVDHIAGAAFILTGSLHGAILAQAYGVPWAAYDDGYVDAPAKWFDWAAYLNVQIKFVTTLAEGECWWRNEGRKGAIRDLAPLLSAFPYPISNKIRQRYHQTGSVLH